MATVRVMGVDPGIKNLAYFIGIFEKSADGKVFLKETLGMDNRVLVPGKYKLQTARNKLSTFWKGIDATMGIQLVAIENQCKLRLINLQKAIKHSLADVMKYACFIKVPPSNLKRLFGISTGSYRQNKIAAVNFVKNHNLLPVPFYMQDIKLDDYADSLLTAYYAACEVLKGEPLLDVHERRHLPSPVDRRPVIYHNPFGDYNGFTSLLDEVSTQLSKIRIDSDGGGEHSRGARGEAAVHHCEAEGDQARDPRK
jgi:hypothetical protein